MLSMASLCDSSHVTPFVMPLVAQGKVTVHEYLLNVNYNFKVETMYVELEIYNDIVEISKQCFC